MMIKAHQERRYSLKYLLTFAVNSLAREPTMTANEPTFWANSLQTAC
jgi:hypothetical protein